jgi:hypothetical protein
MNGLLSQVPNESVESGAQHPLAGVKYTASTTLMLPLHAVSGMKVGTVARIAGAAPQTVARSLLHTMSVQKSSTVQAEARFRAPVAHTPSMQRTVCCTETHSGLSPSARIRTPNAVVVAQATSTV